LEYDDAKESDPVCTLILEEKRENKGIFGIRVVVEHVIAGSSGFGLWWTVIDLCMAAGF